MNCAEDTVIGTLPIHLVADLHVRGIRYVHLSMHVPAHFRGLELSAQQLRDCHIRLENFMLYALTQFDQHALYGITIHLLT
jgi:CRISPR-associated protein Csx16